MANFGAWQGSWEYSESTPWPPLQALLKAGLWVSDREDVKAHRRLLVRPVLSPAVEVSGGEVAKYRQTGSNRALNREFLLAGLCRAQLDTNITKHP